MRCTQVPPPSPAKCHAPCKYHNTPSHSPLAACRMGSPLTDRFNEMRASLHVVKVHPTPQSPPFGNTMSW